MTGNEKELIATIKLSLIRGIIGMDEGALMNLVKKAIEESEGREDKRAIITCKDCKYYRPDDDTGYCTNHTISGDITFWCRDDYYCADAERRDK